MSLNPSGTLDSPGKDNTERHMFPPESRSRDTLGHWVSGLFLVMGMASNLYAYSTPTPIIVGTLLLTVSIVSLAVLIDVRGRELKVFLLVFSSCWFWSGVAAIYAVHFHDTGQNELDAWYFFHMVTNGEAAKLDLLDALLLIENGGAMIIWRTLYDALSWIGFDKSPYIGITLNNIFVALSAVAGVKIAKATYGDDTVRLERFKVLFVLCGMFWLYGSIHLRDAAALFSVTLLALYWVRYLATPSYGNLLKVSVATVVGFLLFGLLRREFVFVPGLMLASGIAASVLAKSTDRRIMILVIIPLVHLIIDPSFYTETIQNVTSALGDGNTTYTDLSEMEGANSLGNSLIVRQPLPIRLILGSAYLFVFPIPFWSGFQLESAYDLFKSFHVLYMYAITPLIGLAACRVWQYRHLRTPPILFLMFVFLGSILGTASSSLENRHFCTFLVLGLVFALLPDISRTREMAAYRALFYTFTGSAVMGHVVWLVLKS